MWLQNMMTSLPAISARSLIDSYEPRSETACISISSLTARPSKLQRVAQQIVRDRARQRRGSRRSIDLRIRAVADHDRPRLAAERRVRSEIARDQLFERDIDHRRSVVRIGRADPDAGIMLEARRRARARAARA